MEDIIKKMLEVKARKIAQYKNKDFEEEILFETVVPSLQVKHENTFIF